MPNIASLLKDEITRLARKEVRAETQSLKSASTRYRSEIAELKRQLTSTQKELKQLQKLAGVKTRKGSSHPAEAEETKGFRFSGPRLLAQRQKLGFTRKQMAALIGVSDLSIYKWERGEVSPRAAQLQAIAAVRGLGKREAAARLEPVKVRVVGNG